MRAVNVGPVGDGELGEGACCYGWGTVVTSKNINVSVLVDLWGAGGEARTQSS